MSIRLAALWSMSGQYVVFAIQFAVSVIISRFFLSPEEVGVFSLALSAAMMVSILQDFGITRYIAGAPELGEERIRTAFSVSLLFAVAIGLLILALAWPAGRFYGDARLTPLLAIIALSYLMVPFAIVPAALLQRELRFGGLFAVNVGGAIVNAAVALGLAWAGYSAFALAWAAVAQQGVRALVARALCGHSLPIRLSAQGAGPILRFGGGMSALYVSGAIGVRSPELIIGKLLGVAAVGLYGRANSLADQLRMLMSGAIGGVFYTAFARMRDRGEPLARPYLRVVAGFSALTWPAMAFLAAASTPLVLMLYGPVWAGVAPLLFWVALGQFAFDALPLHMEVPIVLGRMRTLFRLNILDTIVSVGFLLAAATMGLEAAAMSRLAYGALWFVIYAVFMQRLTGFRWREMAGVYAQSGAASLATVAPLLLLYTRVPPEAVRFPALAGAAVLGVGCWFATLFVVRHPVRKEFLALAAPLWRRLAVRVPRASREGGAP